MVHVYKPHLKLNNPISLQKHGNPKLLIQRRGVHQGISLQVLSLGLNLQYCTNFGYLGNQLVLYLHFLATTIN